MKNDYKEIQFQESETINIREELEKYFIHWRWFVFFVVISFLLSFIYLRYTTPQFSATTSILIKDNNKSGISTELAAFEDLGIVGGGSSNNTDNEVVILKSRKIIGSVIDTLNLDILYFVEGRIKETEIYRNSPITLDFLKKDSLLFFKDTALVVRVNDGVGVKLKNLEGKIQTQANFDEIIHSKLGVFRISENKKNYKIKESYDITIKIIPKYKIITSYKNKIIVNPVSKNSSVINLSINDNVKDKAEDFLNELVKQYNIDAINDKNEVSRKTKDFIEDRLRSVGIELTSIQDSIKNYKKETGFIGVSNEGGLVLETLSRNSDKILSVQTQLNLAKWIQESINNQDGIENLLPENLGFENQSITQSIIKYNELVIQKNRLLLSAGEKNPQLIEQKKEIINYKRNLKQSFTNLRISLELQVQQLNKEQNKINSKKSTIPLIERGFIDIAREQEIISGLYSYLLKKKEETAISLAVAVANAKIIDVAYGSNFPVSPKKNIVYIAALLLGLIVPFVLIYIRNLLNTKIHSRKDIEDLTNIPYLGDVPNSDSKEKIVIGKDARSSTAEAFRLIRTNLDFMLSTDIKSESGKTIFITSTTSGEGKSFVSINLAAALSLSNKKVLLLGLDLRAPKVTEYLGISERKGITNFITNNSLSLTDLKFSIPEIVGLDIIASGAIPPNPAELLLTERVEELFEEVKKDYDYIIVDTAPVNLVTDTLLVSKYADMFLYVARANYLDKRMLVVPQTLYNEKKLPNMAIVLNDTNISRGYGYGYGYGYVQEVKKPWYTKIFKK